MLARILFVLLAFAMSQAVVAGPGDPPPDPPGKTDQKGEKKPKKKAKKAKPEDDRALKAMKLVIEDAEFKEMPFEDFSEWLRRTTKVNVVVRWKIVEKAGVPRLAPITLKEAGITIKKLLELVFAELTEDGKTTELAAQADGNTILISTRADINSKLIVRLYDVQELLVVVPDFAGPPLGESGKGGGPAAGMGRKTPRRKEAEEEKEADLVKELIDAITQGIEPSSWKVNGGKGAIVFFKGQLVIRNNAEVHQILAGMLGHPGMKKQ